MRINAGVQHFRTRYLAAARRLSVMAILLLSYGGWADSAEIDSKVDALFVEFNRPDAPGASVTVIQNGKVLLAKGYGLANVEERIPCTPETNFRLASLTKQFTAMSILILADHKKLSLDESV